MNVDAELAHQLLVAVDVAIQRSGSEAHLAGDRSQADRRLTDLDEQPAGLATDLGHGGRPLPLASGGRDRLGRYLSCHEATSSVVALTAGNSALRVLTKVNTSSSLLASVHSVHKSQH